jgi:hypothetical protein
VTAGGLIGANNFGTLPLTLEVMSGDALLLAAALA